MSALSLTAWSVTGAAMGFSPLKSTNPKNLKNLKAMHQPKTGLPCFCRPGIQRDNCPQCEGTGQQIDFAAIRARRLQSEAPTWENQLAKARKLAAKDGIEALNNPHAMTGRICRCGDCFCCAALAVYEELRK
jgi:CDGSH-type Zn-finger protein